MQTARLNVACSAAIGTVVLAGALLAGAVTGTHATLLATARPAQAIPCRSDPIVIYRLGRQVHTLRAVATYLAPIAAAPEPTRFLIHLPAGAHVLSVWRESAGERVQFVRDRAPGQAISVQTWHWTGLHWDAAHTQTWHWTGLHPAT